MSRLHGRLAPHTRDVAPKNGEPTNPYSRTIAGYRLLTAEEEIALARRIRMGDRAARDRLITANLRLVIKVAGQYLGHGLPIDDLIGEGNLGLLRAAEGFDPGFGVRFGTYAVYWIKQSIRHALVSTTDTIRIPAHAAGLLSKWRRTERRIQERTGRRPAPDRIADELDLSPSRREQVELAIRARGLAHLDPADAHESAGWEPIDHRGQAPESSLLAREADQTVIQRMAHLDPREQAILAYRFGLAGTPQISLKEAGRRLGITREWARVIQIRALQKLATGEKGGRRKSPARPRLQETGPQRPRRSPTRIVPPVGATLATVSAPPEVESLATNANR